MENEILDEIRKVRDEHAEECGYDVHRVFEQMRAESEQLKAEGWRVIDRSVGEQMAAKRRKKSGQSEKRKLFDWWES
jgi:hypothetical protein